MFFKDVFKHPIIHPQMHGRFTSNLREFAHDYAIKLKYQIEEEQQREKDEDDFRSLSGTTFSWQLKCKPTFMSKIENRGSKILS